MAGTPWPSAGWRSCAKSPSLTALHDRVADALPLVDLSELLLEVNAWTGFADAIGQGPGAHPRAPHLAQSVAAVLLADACNIGLAAVADPTERALGADRLAWVRQHYVGAEAIVEANGRLVDVHAELPLARHWGGGHVASADGLRFVVAGRSADAAPNSRYFGLGRGVTYYNFVSDQHTGFHAVVVPGTLRDSLFVLDGLIDYRRRIPVQLNRGESRHAVARAVLQSSSAAVVNSDSPIAWARRTSSAPWDWW